VRSRFILHMTHGQYARVSCAAHDSGHAGCEAAASPLRRGTSPWCSGPARSALAGGWRAAVGSSMARSKLARVQQLAAELADAQDRTARLRQVVQQRTAC
jgi:hypothetical protein